MPVIGGRSSVTMGRSPAGITSGSGALTVSLVEVVVSPGAAAVSLVGAAVAGSLAGAGVSPAVAGGGRVDGFGSAKASRISAWKPDVYRRTSPMARPTDRAASGSFCGPRTSRATTRTTRISSGPMLPTGRV